MKTASERLKSDGSVVGTLPRGLRSPGAWWHWRHYARLHHAYRDAMYEAVWGEKIERPDANMEDQGELHP